MQQMDILLLLVMFFFSIFDLSFLLTSREQSPRFFESYSKSLHWIFKEIYRLIRTDDFFFVLMNNKWSILIEKRLTKTKENGFLYSLISSFSFSSSFLSFLFLLHVHPPSDFLSSFSILLEFILDFVMRWWRQSNNRKSPQFNARN